MIVYGRNTVRQLLESGIGVRQLSIVHSAKGDAVKEIIRIAKQKKIFIHYVENKLADKICGAGSVHQGIFADSEENFILSREEFLSQIQNEVLLLALDQISDPHNIGAIMRSAEILGVKKIILSDKNSANVNATVAKVSSGAVFYLQIYNSLDFDKDLSQLKKDNFCIIVADSHASHSINDLNLQGKKKILVIGNEGTGIRKSTKEMADYLFKIPMKGKTESFNASVAASISMFALLNPQ